MTISVNSPEDIFRRRLRQVREARGLTRRQLAEKLEAVGHHMAATEIRKLETGTKRVLLGDTLAMSYVLDVSPLFLLLPFGTGETTTTQGVTIPVYAEMVTITPGAPQPFDHYTLRTWLRGQEPLPGQDVAGFYGALPPDELAELVRAARELEIGKAAPPGAAALRNKMIETGDANDPPTWAWFVETIEFASALTDSEVLDELKITTFDEQTADAAAEAGVPVEQFRAERIRELRGELLREYYEAALHGRPPRRKEK